MALITCKNLCVGYDKNVVASGLSFAVDRGDYLCIVGENGAGKSTLMKTLLGLQKPISGQIEFGDGLVQTEIGYLPQQTPVQKDFPASVWEVVLSGCLNRCGLRSFYNRAEKQTAEENMKRLGLEQMKNRCYRELSGGQQQRVLLARALCATQRLLILDEPVAGLDPKVTEELYALIESLNQSGITVIMVTHDMTAAIRYASHILHVSHQPLFYGSKAAYLQTQIGQTFAGLSEAQKGGAEA
mgnify:CR=1 FL=1